jgi:hypothetical protein
MKISVVSVTAAAALCAALACGTADADQPAFTFMGVRYYAGTGLTTSTLIVGANQIKAVGNQYFQHPPGDQGNDNDFIEIDRTPLHGPHDLADMCGFNATDDVKTLIEKRTVPASRECWVVLTGDAFAGARITHTFWRAGTIWYATYSHAVGEGFNNAQLDPKAVAWAKAHKHAIESALAAFTDYPAFKA